MNDQEMESVWQEVRKDNYSSLVPSAVNSLLCRIKKGNDWYINGEFQYKFQAGVKGIEVFQRGMAAALNTNQYNHKLKITDYQAMIDPILIPLLKHVARKPRALVEDSKDVKIASGSNLVCYVRDYRERCWCYHQLLTGGTEFTTTFVLDKLLFELDALGTKKVVVKSDKTVNSNELTRLCKELIKQDECDMYDEWVLKQKPPQFETSEAFQDTRRIRDNFFSADVLENPRVSEEYIEHARLAMEEALRYREFETMVQARYPKTWEARWLAVMEVIVDKAPMLMDSRKHSEWSLAELCKLSLKAGYTAAEIIERMIKVKELKEQKEAGHGN